MKIGIFGGCFNPPHVMHKTIATQLVQEGYVDKVIYVPTGDFYPKKDLVSAKDRYEMVKEMIEACDSSTVSSYEIEHNSYTYETLDYFKTKYREDEIYFTCGMDNLRQLSTWKKYQYILENYYLLVINRNNENIDEVIASYPQYKNHIQVIPIVTEPVSSTEIRVLLQKGECGLEHKVDQKVLQYIRSHNLYSK